MSDSWPVGVPVTLWNYGSLEAEDIPQLPMMGVQFARQFVVAFALGCLFLAYFAFVRFNERPSDDKEFRYRVMKTVEVEDLGGSAALRHAYLIYLTTLLLLYVAMAFFGKLIVQTVNALNVVGIRVDASSLQFDSPLWPLMLAFGFAGLAPLIPQLKVAEGWLFRRAYRAVGIPVRIHETTRNLAELLDAASANALKEAPELCDDLAKKLAVVRKKIEGSWAKESLAARPAKLEGSVAVLAELELLVSWAKGGRGAWPGADVSDQVRSVEQELAAEADGLLGELYQRLGENPRPGASAAARREKYLADAFAKARELRDELTAILAVYVERDPTYVGTSDEKDLPEPIRDQGLRELLRKTELPNLAGTGPEFGVLICILFALPVYAIFAWKELHPLLSQQALPTSLLAVLATAGVEGLRLLSVFWFPLLTAFAVRQHYYDEGTWVARASQDGSAYAEQRLTVAGVAFVISVACLSGVAALWAFFIAKDVSGFQELLVGGRLSFLLFYGSMAVATLPLVWLTLTAADARAHRQSAAFYGVLSALLMIVFQTLHLRLWYGAVACREHAAFLTDLFSPGCFLFYGGLDYFIMPLLAYLAASVFGNPRPASHLLRRWRLTRRDQAQVTVAALALVSTCLCAPAALAQGTPGKQTVTVGFRADVEPFSYRIDGGGGTQAGDQPLYKGFLADLCYWIFDGGDYSVIEHEVGAGDRFDKLARGEIDVLCDPVTMRFSDEQRAAAGTFSPIVFATGLSYLVRRNSAPRKSVYVGYVRGTTAEKVLERVCVADLLRKVPADERDELATMCQTAMAAWRIASSGAPDWEKAEAAASDEMHAVRARRVRASGTRAELLDASLKAWTDTVARIGACKTAGDCDGAEIAARLGESCGALEVDAGDPGGPAAGGADPPRPAWSRTVYRFCPQDTHAELIEWFCAPRTGQDVPTLVYLGDREIILGKRQTWNEQHTRRCEVENERGGADLTYEPYALMVAKPRPGDPPAAIARRLDIAALVQRRVYEFFSFRQLAGAKFDTYFLGPRQDRTMSPALAYLFLLNGVEDARRFTYPAEAAAEATD